MNVALRRDIFRELLRCKWREAQTPSRHTILAVDVIFGQVKHSPLASIHREKRKKTTLRAGFGERACFPFAHNSAPFNLSVHHLSGAHTHCQTLFSIFFPSSYCAVNFCLALTRACNSPKYRKGFSGGRKFSRKCSGVQAIGRQDDEINRSLEPLERLVMTCEPGDCFLSKQVVGVRKGRTLSTSECFKGFVRREQNTQPLLSDIEPSRVSKLSISGSIKRKGLIEFNQIRIVQEEKSDCDASLFCLRAWLDFVSRSWLFDLSACSVTICGTTTNKRCLRRTRTSSNLTHWLVLQMNGGARVRN